MATPQIKITNQKPAIVYTPNTLLPNIDPSLPEDDYINEQIDYLEKRMVTPLFQPLSNGSSVKMQDISDPKNPIEFTDGAVTKGIWTIWESNTIDPELESQLNELYRQSLQFSQSNQWLVEHQMGQEAISYMNNQTKGQWPLPQTSKNAPLVYYTPQNDLIPQAKALLAHSGDLEKTAWFAGLSGYLKPKQFDNFVLVTVQSHAEFDQFKQEIEQIRQNNVSSLDKKVNDLLISFQNVSLDGELSTGMFLPTPHAREVNSFTRIILNALADKEQNQNDLWSVQPINSRQLVSPEHLIVLNLEEYAHATAKEINDDWDELQKAFNVHKKLNLVSKKKLMTAKSVQAMQSTSSTGGNRKSQSFTRRAQVPFSKKPITSEKITKLMGQVINRSISQKRTENQYKSESKSYMRPNRRNPNDPNLMGKLTKIKYRPDIHIYLDTSGSISESQYRDAVGALIKFVQKMDTNLYLTTFSDYITQTHLLKTRGRSKAQVYKDFLRVPKASGGTDFENVWVKIDKVDELNKKTNKSYQINFVITDFGYGLQRDRRFEPGQASYKYTYYVPISIDRRGWSGILHMAKSFKRQMEHAGAKAIRKHMLM